MNITKLKKTLLSLIIVLVGLLPVNVNAASIVIKYDNNLIKEGTTKVGEGNIIFDSTNNVLTLDNVNLVCNNSWECLTIDGNANDILTIILKGNNSITTTDPCAILSSISLNIEGPGNLIINSYAANSGFAIDAYKDLTISNANINFKGIPTSSSNAINCIQVLTINNSIINIDSFYQGLVVDYGYANIKYSTINFKEVNFGIISGLYKDDKTILYNTDINVEGLKDMYLLTSTGNILIDKCNINASNNLTNTGIFSIRTATINSSNINLNSDRNALLVYEDLSIVDSNANLNSISDSAIKSRSVNISNSDVYAKSKTASSIHASKNQLITLPRNDLIVIDNYLEEISNYKIITSDYEDLTSLTSVYDSIFTIDGLPLKEDSSNIAKEIHLRVKKADYSAVDTAISSIPKDLSIYITTSVNSLNAIVNAVVRDLKITEQARVDKYATNINKAIKELEIKVPTMSEGNNQTIVEGNDAIFRSDAKLQDFIKAMVDGKDVDISNYELVSGSTILTLKKSYLNGLSAGTHTLAIVSKNGTATANFITKKNSKPIPPKPLEPVDPVTPAVPNTGLSTNYNLILSLMFISSIGIVKVIKRKE